MKVSTGEKLFKECVTTLTNKVVIEHGDLIITIMEADENMVSVSTAHSLPTDCMATLPIASNVILIKVREYPERKK